MALVFEQVKTGQYGPQWDVICSVAAKVGGASSEVEYSGARHMDRICARRDGRAWEAAVHLSAGRRASRMNRTSAMPVCGVRLERRGV